MKAVLTSLRRLVLGETWTIPLGVGASLVLALLIRAAVSEDAWTSFGGFALAGLVITTLAHSLRGHP